MKLVTGVQFECSLDEWHGGIYDQRLFLEKLNTGVIKVDQLSDRTKLKAR